MTRIELGTQTQKIIKEFLETVKWFNFQPSPTFWVELLFKSVVVNLQDIDTLLWLLISLRVRIRDKEQETVGALVTVHETAKNYHYIPFTNEFSKLLAVLALGSFI